MGLSESVVIATTTTTTTTTAYPTPDNYSDTVTANVTF